MQPVGLNPGTPALCVCSVAQSRPTQTPWTVAHQVLCLWNFPGKNIGVGCRSLLQGSSWPRDRTRVSCMVGRFFTIWATREWFKGNRIFMCRHHSLSSSRVSRFRIRGHILHPRSFALKLRPGFPAPTLSLKDMVDVQYFQSFLKGIVIFQM